MEKVRPWCGQPSDRTRLKNRTENASLHEHTEKDGQLRTSYLYWMGRDKIRPSIRVIIMITITDLYSAIRS